MKESFQDINIEELVDEYKKTASDEVFRKLFTACHRDMLKFLLNKKSSIEDAEDVLQDYFSRDFEKAIQKFDRSQQKFINYIKQMVLMRYFSSYKRTRKRRDRNINSFDDPKNDGFKNIHYTKSDDLNAMLSLMKNEIRDFFRDIVLSIKKEEHRNAIILKLCLPFKLSVVEIAKILDCDHNLFSTWVYRAVMELKEKIIESKKAIPFDLEDIQHFAKQESFALKQDVIDNIQDKELRNILELFFFSKKSIDDISSQLNKPVEDVKILLRTGIFNILSLLNQRELLFRKGEPMYIEQNDLIQFIDSLDNDSISITTRNSITTGDHYLDNMLRTIHHLFHDQYVFSHSSPSIKDQLFNKMKEQKLSLNDMKDKMNLSLQEVNLLLSDPSLLAQESLSKLKDFLGNTLERTMKTDDNNFIDEESFQSMNDRLLNHFYQNKKI